MMGWRSYNQGMLAEGGGVVDFLEVILSDFARLESETSASEAGEQDAYEQFMFESKKDKAFHVYLATFWGTQI